MWTRHQLVSTLESEHPNSVLYFRPRDWEELRAVPKHPKQKCFVGRPFQQSGEMGHFLLSKGIFGLWALTSRNGERGSTE